jgi:hypothetical protein
VLGTEEPGGDYHQAKEGHSDQKLALHGRASKRGDDTKSEGAFMRLVFLRDR